MGLPGPRRRLGSSARGGFPLMCNVDRRRQAGCHSAQPGCGRIQRRRGPYVQPFARGGTLVACPGVMYIWGTRWRARARAHTPACTRTDAPRARMHSRTHLYTHTHTLLSRMYTDAPSVHATHETRARTAHARARARILARTLARTHARTHARAHTFHTFPCCPRLHFCTRLVISPIYFDAFWGRSAHAIELCVWCVLWYG
jgi:hypothetical protein